jgi:hypothetical protein
MTRSEWRIVIAAAVCAFAALCLPPLAATPATAAGAPPFCVLRGGPDGDVPPQICAYSDYQQCLQAAADLHGNCVQNIDYHGVVSTAPAPARARQRRRH